MVLMNKLQEYTDTEGCALIQENKNKLRLIAEGQMNALYFTAILDVPVVVRICPHDFTTDQKFHGWLQCLMAMDHQKAFPLPPIPILLRRFTCPSSKFLPLLKQRIRDPILIAVVEYCPLGTMDDFFNNHQEDKVSNLYFDKCWINVFKQVVLVLAAIQTMSPGFVHGDLHTENILLRDNGRLKPHKVVKFTVEGETYRVGGNVLALLADFDFSLVRNTQVDVPNEDFEYNFKEKYPSSYWDLFKFCGSLTTRQFRHPPPKSLLTFIFTHLKINANMIKYLERRRLVKFTTWRGTRAEMQAHGIKEVMPADLLPFLQNLTH